MAVSTVVKSTQALKLAIGTSTTTGGSSCSQYYQLPILTPPTVVDLHVPTVSSPPVLGTYTESSNHTVHDRTGQMFEISFSVLCNPNVLDLLCLYAYEDGDGTNILVGNYSPPNWINGATATDTQIIYIGGGGYEIQSGTTDNQDVYYVGCVCTSVEITHAIDSEGGKPVANVTFQTGYSPAYGDNFSDGAITVSNLAGTTGTDFDSWVFGDTYIDTDDESHRIHPYSYSISFARTIERVGWVDTTDFSPNGYVWSSGTSWDVSMNCVYKRDSQFDSIKANLVDSGVTNMRIGDNGTPFRMAIVGVVSDHSVDTGSAELRNSTTIKGMNDTEAVTGILSLEM